MSHVTQIRCQRHPLVSELRVWVGYVFRSDDGVMANGEWVFATSAFSRRELERDIDLWLCGKSIRYIEPVRQPQRNSRK